MPLANMTTVYNIGSADDQPYLRLASMNTVVYDGMLSKPSARLSLNSAVRPRE
jgi:hypothetical protein